MACYIVSHDWNAFVEHCRGINLLRRESDTGINLMKISNESPPEVLFSIEISTDFKVTCYVKSSKVNVRNLINAFNHKLEKYSQLNNIISVLGDTNLSLHDEVKTCAKKVVEFCQFTDDPERIQHYEMISGQLEKSTCGKNGRRYTPSEYTKAIDIYLKSRSAHKAIRHHLILPHHKSRVYLVS